MIRSYGVRTDQWIPFCGLSVRIPFEYPRNDRWRSHPIIYY